MPPLLRPESSQVTRGLLHPPTSPRTQCTVVANQWPGWLAVLPSLNFTCTQCYTENISSAWIANLTKAHPHCQLRGLQELKFCTDKPTFVFIQGSHDLLPLLPHAWLRDAHILASLSSTDIGPAGWPALVLSHLFHGGVIRGCWGFFINRGSFGEQAVSPAPQRRLRHIIDQARATSHFREIDAPEEEFHMFQGAKWVDLDHTILDWNGALPIEWPHALVRCQMNFVQSKWVVRPLTVKEHMAAADIPDHILPEGILGRNHRKVVEGLPFLYAAPLRLLTHALRSWSCCTPQRVKNISFEHSGFSLDNLAWPSTVTYRWQGAASAAKADDAETPCELWDKRVWRVGHSKQGVQSHCQRYGHCPLSSLRSLFLRRWRRIVTSSLLRFLRLKHGKLWTKEVGAVRDIAVGRDCIQRTVGADWWEWRAGSTPFFWRWHMDLHDIIRDGRPPWFRQEPPQWLKPQRAEPNERLRSQIKEKLLSIKEKGYISKGYVESLTSYFAVPKGDFDIRMVYDASASGLNDSLWAPSFSLPGSEALLDLLTVNSWMSDLDMGEQFLNFHLHPQLQQFCGVDLRPYLGPTDGLTNWLRWSRCMMGLLCSPYFAIKDTYLGEEIAMGDRMQSGNPLRWERVILNLPGSPAYDPTFPWVRRVKADGSMAGGMPRYVDDMRPVGDSEEHCWAVTHHMASMYCYLGLQVASRKTRPPSQQSGPWAGTVALITPGGVGVACIPDKWKKAQGLVKALQQELAENTTIAFKPLEKMRGFLVHLQRTYPVITPFLKGLHLTLDGWRPNRDEELWAIPHMHNSAIEPLNNLRPQAPERVRPAPRLSDDLTCLDVLFASSEPPVRTVRAARRLIVIYGFVDASGSGFGSSFTLPDNSIYFRHGLWGRDTDSDSSNFRELSNLVAALEEGVTAGELRNSELFIFTDNTTAEGAYYKGNSPSRKLFDLVLRLRCIEMMSSVLLHVIHVAGTRMIAQGTDGLSRGVLTEGIFATSPMAVHIPLHLSAFEQSESLLTWCRSWVPDPHITPLTPEDWFTTGHGVAAGYLNTDGVWIPALSTHQWFLWAPPPAAGRHALAELAVSRHKRTHLNHVVVCPRLFTATWRKQLYKLADIVIEVPAGARPFWPLSMHEPLIIGLTLRFISHPPWILKNHSRVLDLGRQLRQVWQDRSGDERDLLRQLCLLPSELEGLP
jgi:hypothetical protein